MAIDKGSLAPSQAALYTDLNQLNNLKVQARSDQQAALETVAQEFEQLFMNMMLKSMRQASDVLASENPFNSGDVKFYQEMLDQQMTMDLSKQGSIGLADIIVRQLSQQPVPAVTPGQNDADEAGEQSSLTEQMLARAFGNGPLPQASGSAYQAPVSETAAAEESDPVDGAVLDEPVGTDDQKPTGGNLPARFETPAEFVEQLLPLAEQAGQELGVAPSVLLAQAALETGWGKFITRDANTGRSSYNLFNIKAHSGWNGNSVQVQTLEYRGGVPEKEQARFRAYENYADSFSDYVNFLRSNPRYQQALEQGADPTRFVRELHNAGYATDPEYANKIERIFSGDLLAGLAHGAKEG